MGATMREAVTEVFRNDTEAAVWASFASYHGASRADELLVEYRKRRALLDKCLLCEGKGETYPTDGSYIGGGPKKCSDCKGTGRRK